MIRQNPERGFKLELLIVPRKNPAEVETAVQGCLQGWSHQYPGLSMCREGENILIDIPDELRTSHEEHFCQVRNRYLNYLVKGFYPPENPACIVSKYTLLAEARKLALTSPFEPI